MQQRFSDTSDVAVTEDAEHAGEKRVLRAVAGDTLRTQELHDGLAHG